MTKAEFLRLRLCYSAACISFQQATGVQREIALDSANRIWAAVAEEVALREIRRAVRARQRMEAA